jgi:hypothetical protein
LRAHTHTGVVRRRIALGGFVDFGSSLNIHGLTLCRDQSSLGGRRGGSCGVCLCVCFVLVSVWELSECVLCDLGVSAHVPLLHLLSLAECFCTTCRCAIRHGGEYICLPSPQPPSLWWPMWKKDDVGIDQHVYMNPMSFRPSSSISPILWVFLILSTWCVFYVCKKAIGSDVSADEEEVRACRCVSCFLLVFFFISFYFCTPRGEAVQGRPFEQLVCLVSLSLFSFCVCVLISCCFYITRIAAHLVWWFLMGNHRLALDCNSGCRHFSFYCYYLFDRLCLDIRSPIFTSVSTPVSCQGKKKTERERKRVWIIQGDLVLSPACARAIVFDPLHDRERW